MIIYVVSTGTNLNLSAEQEAWILARLDMVPPIARARHRRLPPSYEVEDLIQAGRMGLVLAVRTLDPSVDGDHWARACIGRQIDQVVVGRQLTDGAGGKFGEQWWYATHRQADPVSEETPIAEAVEEIDADQLRARVAAAKDGLTGRQRDLLDLVFWHCMSLREIGRKKLLGIGWRRVMREYREALHKLQLLLETA